MAIEKNTKEVVNTLFADELKMVLSCSGQWIFLPRREKNR